MVTKKTWDEFRNSGFLWWTNMILHTFGWALCVELDENGVVTDCYPGRVKYRGFTENINTAGYRAVSEYMVENAVVLHEEAES